MSKLGEMLAWKINRVFPTLPIHSELESAKRGVESNQEWSYEEALRVLPGFDPYWNVRGKHVLDIGSGLGGKIPAYIQAGAGKVTGIEISLDDLRWAKQHPRLPDNGEPSSCQIDLINADASLLPFPKNSFDAVVSINVFEHIEKVDLALKEIYRVLKPSGLAYLHLPPYYSPWGPHLENWIHFPWPHLFFSDRTLLRVAAREDALKHLNENFVAPAQINWELSGDRIPGVNRITLRRFRNLTVKAGFKILQLKLFTVGYDFLESRSSRLARFAHTLLNWGAQIPGLQEIIVTKMVYVLQKAS